MTYIERFLWTASPSSHEESKYQLKQKRSCAPGEGRQIRRHDAGPMGEVGYGSRVFTGRFAFS